MIWFAVGVSIATQHYTPYDSLKLVLDFASPLVVALQQGMLLWVVSRLRSTSRDVQWTSQVAAQNFVELHKLQGRNVSLPDVPGRKKSSTKGITSTSPGERKEPGHSGR